MLLESSPARTASARVTWTSKSKYDPWETVTYLASLVFYRFRKAGYAAIDQICDYYKTMEQRPVVSQVEPGYLRKLLPGRNIVAPCMHTDHEQILSRRKASPSNRSLAASTITYSPVIDTDELISTLLSCCVRRNHTLAASELLRILPFQCHLREHARRDVRDRRQQSRLQRESQRASPTL